MSPVQTEVNVMAQCAYCEADTFMYDRGVPICIKCSGESEAKRKPPVAEQQIRTRLLQDMLGATAHSREAASEFDEGP